MLGNLVSATFISFVANKFMNRATFNVNKLLNNELSLVTVKTFICLLNSFVNKFVKNLVMA